MSKNISIPNIKCRFPSVNQFQKMTNKFNTKVKPKESKTLPEPMLPEYLRELESEENPFTKIITQNTATLKIEEKERTNFNKNKGYSITETVQRSTRIKFNANYKLKKFKYYLDLVEMNKKEREEPMKSLTRTKSIPIDDFLLTKRQTCLLNLAINVKDQDIKILDKIVEDEEKSLQLLYNDIKSRKDEHFEHLKSVCQKTYETVNLVEKETKRKKFILRKVKKVKFALSKVNSECIQLEEQYLKLKSYKTFLVKCKSIQTKKESLERPSLINELQTNAIQMENKLNLVFSSQLSYSGVDSVIAPISDKSSEIDEIVSDDMVDINDNNIYTSFQTNNITLPEPSQLFFSKDQLEKLKGTIFLGFDHNNNRPHEENDEINRIIESYAAIRKHDVGSTETDSKEMVIENDKKERFMISSPQELINILTDLEINNLSLIENVQEQEEACDIMRQKINKFKIEMDDDIIIIDKRIRKENKEIERIKESIMWIRSKENILRHFNTLDRYNEFFYLKDFNIVSLDGLIDYMGKEIYSLYSSLFENNDKEESRPGLLEMLKSIEILVDSLYVEIRQYDISLIHKAKKVINQRKRKEFHLRQKNLNKEKEANKLRKVIDTYKMEPKYRFGKKVMYRSPPPKPVVEIIGVNEDDLRKEEEMLYFFT